MRQAEAVLRNVGMAAIPFKVALDAGSSPARFTN